jgi:UDP-N-acetylmuramyl pentapeptide phosphotransferase/UDP-N-acetylglucosamine-1-phosphate transferase
MQGTGAPLAMFALAAAASAAVLWTLLRTGLAWRLAIDAPNQRSLHARPTPRIGGLATTPVVLAVAAAFGLLPLAILAAAAVLAAVSLLDDHHGLPAAARFAIQCACAAAVAWTSAPLPPWALALAIVALVWITNLYNFMDGSDGLAGGMALIGFGACAIGAATRGDLAIAAAAATIAGAAAGFLLFNWPPARVFLGDVGSIPTGFLAGAIGLRGWLAGDWPWWFAPLVFSPFIADATLTLLARLARRERVWQAHREHIYQRMVTHGFGHRGTALWWYALMALAAACALALRGAGRPASLAMLAGWIVLYIAAFAAGKKAWPLKATAG